MIEILIVEDNAAYLDTLKEMIEATDDMTLHTAWRSAESAVNALCHGDFPSEALLLLDLNLPWDGGLSVIPAFRKACPEGNVVVLTQNDNELVVLEAIQAGAVGYLLKDSPIAELRAAIRDIHGGGSVIDAKFSRYVLQALGGHTESNQEVLSPREHQVLELMAMGKGKKEVADQLDISYHAVALYTRNIYKKLESPNITAAVATAIRRGLI
jgi:DNA-binding NarL/FixJ family response regulator